MEYNEKPLMKEDCLKIIRFFASDIFQSKLAKFLLWLHLLGHSAATLITIYYFLYKLEKKEFISYAPIAFGILYGITGIITLLLKSKCVANIKEKFPLWAIESAGETIYKKIKTEIAVLTTTTIFIVLIVSVAGIFFAFPYKHNKEFYVVVRSLEEYFPKQRTVFTAIAYAMYPLMSYVMLAHALQLVYYSQHLKFQWYLFGEHKKNIGNYPQSTNKEELFYDQDYQNEVRRRLIFCVKRHQEIIIMQIGKTREIRPFFAVFYICRCLLGISILLFVFSGNVYEEYFTSTIIVSFGFVLTFSVLFIAAQSAETEQDNELIQFNDICWYNFNIQNRKIYLLFLLNAMKQRRITFTENYSINYNLALKARQTSHSFNRRYLNPFLSFNVIKSVYSVVSVLIKLKN